MCTALSFSTKAHYFGRNLDIDCSYGEEVCVMPRKFSLVFSNKERLEEHYAIIGMATVAHEIPLFYDAANEYGLAMAGLNFPGNAYYQEPASAKENIAPFEFITWILAKCKTVKESRELLKNLNIVNIPFSEKLPLSPLHWMISDKKESIVVEAMRDGLHVHDNPAGVLTNNPPFEVQMFNLNNYRNLRVDSGENNFLKDLELDIYCQGLGAIGLPGDVSSMSRFVRMTFNSKNSVCEGDEEDFVSQFFHLLSSVEMNRGCCQTESGKWDITLYSSCINTEKGLYYYTTYDNRQINCVDMYNEDLDNDCISRFPLIKGQQIYYQNSKSTKDN